MRRRNLLQHLQRSHQSNLFRWLKTNPWMRTTLTYSSRRWGCQHSAPCESCYPTLTYRHIHSHMPGKDYFDSTDQSLFLTSGKFCAEQIRFVFAFSHNQGKRAFDQLIWSATIDIQSRRQLLDAKTESSSVGIWLFWTSSLPTEVEGQCCYRFCHWQLFIAISLWNHLAMIRR